jgi:hypothetical protein
MQVMPYMAEGLPLAGNLSTIESNVEAGCFILADNIRRLGEENGISSYFWGRNIRGVAYLEKVEQARARVREAALSLRVGEAGSGLSEVSSNASSFSIGTAAPGTSPESAPRIAQADSLAES